MPQALTTLSSLKDWLGIPASQTNTDTVLEALLRRASQKVYSVTARPSFFPHLVSDLFKGNFRPSVMLRQYPVLSIQSVTVNGVPVPPAVNPQQAGYLLQPWDGFPPGASQLLDFYGFDTGYGAQATMVTYYAGYQITSEEQTVPASGTAVIRVDAPYGPWAGDRGVVYAATGEALTQVPGAPSGPGEYQLVDTAPGDYAFSSGDASAAILISYGFVPGDIEQAVLEFAGDRDSYRRRIGVLERAAAGGGLTAYEANGPTQTFMDLIQPFKRVQSG